MPMLAFTVVVQSQTSLYSRKRSDCSNYRSGVGGKMLWHVHISLNQSQLDAARVPLQDRVEGSRFTVACGELSPGLFTFVPLASVSQLLWACFVLCFHSGVALFLPPSSLSLCGRPHLILLAGRYKVLLVLMCRSQSD